MVILGEDLAALLGLALALIAVLMTILTGNPMWDGLGSMWIGVVLIAVAIGIGREIMALLIGQSAEPETEARLREFLEKQDGVEKVYRLITLQLGTSLMVAVKARMKAAARRSWSPRSTAPRPRCAPSFPRSSGCSSSPTSPTDARR